MPQLNRLIIIQENAEPISLIVNLNQENHFLYSQEVLSGDIQTGIKNLIETSIESQGDFYPIDHGLNIIDFKEKEILSMNRRSWPSEIPFIALKGIIDLNHNLHLALKNNLVNIVHKKTQTSYSVQEFFGTNEVYQIKLLLEDNYPDYRKESKGVITQYAHEFLSTSFAKFIVKPYNCDLINHNIDPNDAQEMFFKLYDKIQLDEKNIQSWLNYSEDYLDSQVLENAIKTRQEKDRLEKVIMLQSVKKGIKI
jgi:hypothetical protein